MMPLRSSLLGCLIVFASCRAAGAVEADPYLPSSTQMVACVEVRQLLDAPAITTHFRDGIKHFITTQPGLAALSKLLAVDPLQDIERVTVAGPAAIDPGPLLWLIRGRFERAKSEAALAERLKNEPESLRVFQKDERRYYQYKGPAAANSVFFAFLDKQTLVAATTREPVLEALTRKPDRETTALNKELHGLLAKIDGKPTVWLAAVATPALKKELAPTPEYQRFVDSLQGVRGSVTVGTGVQADLRIQTSDARVAVEIRKFMEGVKSMLILTAVNQDKKNGAIWGDLLALLKVANDGETVTVKGQATPEQIEKSIENNRKAKKE